MSSLILINLVGGVALLLWGLRLVRIGVSDGWGAAIRGGLGASLDNRFTALMSGLGVTLLLQSSSATALLTASFSGQGILSASTALTILLGADIGTTLVAQLLTFDLSAMSPLLIAVGVGMFTYFPNGRARDSGRIALGIGIMLLALDLIVSASLPMRESVMIQQLFSALGEDRVLAVILAAFIAWASHSSLATVLLIISLASTSALPLEVAFAFVLGANIGGAIPPFINTLAAPRSARQPTLGNLLFRIGGVILVLPLVDLFAGYMAPFDIGAGRHIANFHLLFNLLLATCCFPLVNMMVNLTDRLLPPDRNFDDAMQPRELDRDAFETPLVALLNAEREVLRMGELVERMLRNAFVAMKKNDDRLALDVIKMDDTVNAFYDTVKRYLTQLGREPLGEAESRRCSEILSFATNLEHVGDIVSDDLAQNIRRKKLVSHTPMSLRDREDLNDLYHPVLKMFQLSMAVFTSGDVAMARQLLARKYKFVKRERKAVMNHLKKLRQDSAYDSRLSAFQLDVIRDLKRINSLLTAVAYPILDKAGQLRSRLRHSKQQSDSASRAATSKS